MNFNASRYELFLKLVNDKSDEIKNQFEMDQIDIDIPLNKFQWTPLQIAAYRGNMVLVDYFLHKGANKDYKNPSGFNAEMLARSQGHQDVSDFIGEFVSMSIEVLSQ
jgi:ankyrin repeat protein